MAKNIADRLDTAASGGKIAVQDELQRVTNGASLIKMKRIYRIVPDPSAPELVIEGGVAKALMGQPLAPLSPDKPFLGRVTRIAGWSQFFRVGANAFALSEEAWDQCEQMFYALRENSIEFPAVRTAEADFAIINPLQILPPSDDPSQLCDLTHAGSIFRLLQCPEEVFCLEGIVVPKDEFKRAYESCGFGGLAFEEVWRAE